MIRALCVPVLLLAACGGDEIFSSADGLYLRVDVGKPCVPASLQARVSRAGGFAAFEDVTLPGDRGAFMLTSDENGDVVLDWPADFDFENVQKSTAFLAFDTTDPFEATVLAEARDAMGRVIARAETTIIVPSSGFETVNLAVDPLEDDCTATRKPLGSSCAAGLECESGFCADDVCCDSACDGECQLCSATTGVCGAVPDSQADLDSCGECRECQGGECQDVTNGQDPFGHCRADNETCNGECRNGACDYGDVVGDRCQECHACDAAGACEPIADNTRNAGDCGDCQVCVSGACEMVGEDEDPLNDCPNDDGCGGLCDGEGACNAWVEGDACGSAVCTDNALHVDECDGTGACIADPDPEDCGAYLCIEDPAPMCTEECTSNADCAPGIALCDLRDEAAGVCAALTVPGGVTCTLGNELQDAISACGAGPCFFAVTGDCDPTSVTDKHVYIDGQGMATIRGFTINESPGNEASVALVSVDIKNASGVGVEATSSGDTVDVLILDAAVSDNSGEGISATLTKLVVRGSAISANDDTGVLASSGSSVVIESTTISNNGLVGGLPGVSLQSSSFDITNSVIVRNGSLGVSVFALTEPPEGKTFRHNTIADNLGGGMQCSGSGGVTTIVSSLFWHGATSQEIDGCVADGSSDIPDVDIGEGADACSNDEAAPGFVSPGLPLLNYHLLGTSPCLDKIACSDVMADFEGDARSGMCEPGADEVP